jgi:ABC-type polysaccharide/polyol phosphate transport system ATPase subunit
MEPGAAVGLIGTNGSGKSTLLRMLTRVMYPYAGEIEVSGRVGALIDVDAGLHPELTGRENIFLCGSLNGLSDAEIRGKLDEIVDFAGLDAAIDRQVKHYSTGMRMRLGFTVATAAEPDILLIDEVLAVGDTSFQAKCIVKITQALNNGTTVVLVSHDLLALEAVCKRAIWLDEGVVMADGPTKDTLAAYRFHIERSAEAAARRGAVRLVEASVSGSDGGPSTQQAMSISLLLESDTPQEAHIYIGVSEGTAAPIFTLRHPLAIQEREQQLTCRIDRLPLARGRYYLWMDVLKDDGTLLMEWQPVLQFEVGGKDLHGAPIGLIRLAPIHVDSDWEA